MTEPTRPLLRWHGGKWLLAPWIIAHLPPHRCYVEPFGGAGSVLLRKPVSYAEVWNDLDGDVVNLFRVLRDPSQAEALRRAVEMTPFARDEFVTAYVEATDPIERARRLIIRSFMGFGSNAHVSLGVGGGLPTGFRANSNRSGTTPAHDWANYPDSIPAFVRRLRGVVIERMEVVPLMRRHDGLDTLHYVDPPYVHATRSAGNQYCRKHMYRHELDDAAHVALLKALRGLAGLIVLSGYPSRLYDESLADWLRVERPALADGARERTEVLWINPRAAAALDRQHMPLFGEVA